MKYDEILNFMYGSGRTRSVDDLPQEDKLPMKVVQFFNSRGGFDHWWDDIDRETRDEIFDELRALLAEK